jgi:hypothetical protein
MEEELLPTSHSNTKLECRGQGYTATVKAKIARGRKLHSKIMVKHRKGEERNHIFLFLLSIKNRGKNLITVAFRICKMYTAFISATNFILRGFSVAI